MQYVRQRLRAKEPRNLKWVVEAKVGIVVHLKGHFRFYRSLFTLCVRLSQPHFLGCVDGSRSLNPVKDVHFAGRLPFFSLEERSPTHVHFDTPESEMAGGRFIGEWFVIKYTQGPCGIRAQVIFKSTTTLR